MHRPLVWLRGTRISSSTTVILEWPFGIDERLQQKERRMYTFSGGLYDPTARGSDFGDVTGSYWSNGVANKEVDKV